MNNSIIYALDFDGVICDSAVETAMTGWKAAVNIWPEMSQTVPKELVSQFKLVRPIIETGFEAILAMRLLYLQTPINTIYQDYTQLTQALLTEAKLTTDDLKSLFGSTRDAWIENDLAEWINQNPLFNNVADKLQQLHNHAIWYVVTTKQERFVKQILSANTIDLDESHIYGLDCNMNKPAVLEMLLNKHPNQEIYFVEDRLPTLLNVIKIPELSSVKLLFALWGYNTATDKQTASQEAITLQELEDFLTF